MINLHLVLTYYWFDEILAGRKRIEYRELTHYWYLRIHNKRKRIKTVTFSRGYTKTKLTFDVTKIDIGDCPYDGWDDNYNRIYFK